MIKHFVIFISLLGFVYPTYCSAQSDSVFAVNVKDIRSIEDSTVRVLAIGFKLPRNYDYTDIPLGLDKLMILEGTKNTISFGALLPAIASLKVLWLSGESVKFLPEFLDVHSNLRSLHLLDGNFHDIFHEGGFLHEHQIDKLVLTEMNIDDNCAFYENIFLSENLKVQDLFVHDNSGLGVEQLRLLRRVFEPENISIR